MGTATYTRPNYSTQSGSVYPSNIDAMAKVFERLAGAFAPHEQTSGSPAPDMTVVIDAGPIFQGGDIDEKPQQTVTGFTAPSSGTRIDRVVLDPVSGDAIRITGAALAGSPSAVPPDVPVGKVSLCKVTITSTDTSITNSMIDDERVLWTPGVVAGAFVLSGVLTPAQIASAQNDYNPVGMAGASVLRLSTDTTRTITGIAGGANGRTLCIENVGSFGILLANADTSSLAANRFLIDGNFILEANHAAWFWYDSTSSRWRHLFGPTKRGAVQVFTASGTYTPTSGMRWWRATAIGGAGAGGGTVATGGGQVAVGAGGNSGGLAIKTGTADDIAGSQTVTIGAGGTGVSGATGNAGSATTLGALLSAKGGEGGAVSTATTIGIVPASASSQSATGDVRGHTGLGRMGIILSAAAGSFHGGDGGETMFGGGGTGGGTSGGIGQAGQGFGAGGGGSSAGGSASAQAGGDGKAGILIIEEFF